MTGPAQADAQAAQGSGGIHHWRYLESVRMWPLGTWFSGALGSVFLTDGLDVKSPFQPK